jgi:hypothetical protein
LVQRHQHVLRRGLHRTDHGDVLEVGWMEMVLHRVRT